MGRVIVRGMVKRQVQSNGQRTSRSEKSGPTKSRTGRDDKGKESRE